MTEKLKALRAENVSLRAQLENLRVSLQGEFSESEIEFITNFFLRSRSNLQVSKSTIVCRRRKGKERNGG